MQIREHADATGDKPAVIIHPAGTVVTFKELEERANRLAHHFRHAGLRRGRHRRGAHGEQRASAGGDVGGAAQRSLLHGGQHPPHAARGGLHHRQQRREGRDRVTGDAQGLRRSGGAGRAARSAVDRRRRCRRAGSAIPSVWRTDRAHPSTTRSRAICCSTRREPRDAPREFAANSPTRSHPKPRTWSRRC